VVPPYNACSELFSIAERLVFDEFCKNKGYDRSKADAGKYAEAVLGKKGIVDCNGVAVAHVGVATVSTEDRHWEPWTGFRTVRPNIQGPACQRGSTIRNAFCFNAQERENRSRLREERIKRIVGEAADLIWNRGPAQATLQEMTSQAGDILQRLGRLVEPFKEDLENAKT